MAVSPGAPGRVRSPGAEREADPNGVSVLQAREPSRLAVLHVTVMRNIAVELRTTGSFDLFTRDVITTDEIRQFVSREPMK